MIMYPQSSALVSVIGKSFAESIIPYVFVFAIVIISAIVILFLAKWFRPLRFGWGLFLKEGWGAEIRKIGAFLKKDLKIMTAYRFSFFTRFPGIAFNLFYIVLFGSMFALLTPPQIAGYGGNFISYLLVGSVGWGLLWGIMSANATSLRTEMLSGTLESILLTPTKITTMVLADTISGIFSSLISIVFLLFVGWAFFGVTAFTSMSIYTIIIFILSALMMMGFGMIFGGLTIWIKAIGQTTSLIQGVAMFFCGVYFPITVLPGFLQPVAKFVPFYYPIEGLRRSLLAPQASEMMIYIGVILVCAVVFILLGLYTLRKGLAKAKKEGTLAFY
jgi:ABC-2 type transport system permease protein